MRPMLRTRTESLKNTPGANQRRRAPRVVDDGFLAALILAGYRGTPAEFETDATRIIEKAGRRESAALRRNLAAAVRYSRESFRTFYRAFPDIEQPVEIGYSPFSLLVTACRMLEDGGGPGCFPN